MPYKYRRTRTKTRIIFGSVLVVALLAIAGGIYGSRQYYFNNLKPISSNQTTQTIVIKTGSSITDVATLLKQEKLIRSDWAFTQYTRTQNLQDSILAGTYSLSPSQSVKEIVTIITQGKISSKLFTIKPGQRIDQIKQAFINAGFDATATEEAFKPSAYANHPALVDKPADASLEGYLYPESFQKTAETTPSQIITFSLDEMQKRLTPEIRAAIAKQGISIHEGVTLASIVEREVSSDSDRAQVAQVFLKRLKEGKKLESDATASYGAILAGQVPSLTFDSPYNTYRTDGLPPGPISNVSVSSLSAVAYPAQTDWLYFVSGDDGTTYFNRTLQEHEASVAQHCKKLCNN
ncbi:MAG: endolytic transglycosylase MltG [Candidatus Saccharibacteria bacterium]|nr:endolytic transglycosylase MltG [Candidatus Saccharibacteria bacterium]